jgi:hypothetical protein
MFSGPFYVQVLHGRSLFLRPWKMYDETGTGFFEVKYRLRAAEGEVPIDRFKVFGYSNRHKAPTWLWRVVRKEDLLKINQALCQYYGSDADIRLYARLATLKGWVPYARGEKNLCGR